MSKPRIRWFGQMAGTLLVGLLVGSVMLTPALAHKEKGERHKHLFKVLDGMGLLTKSEGDAAYLGKTATAANADTLGGAALNSIAAGNDLYIPDCNPTSETYIQCGTTPGAALTLTRESKVLVIYGWAWSNQTEPATGSLGRCITTRNGVATSGEIDLGLLGEDHTQGGFRETAIPIIDVQGPLPPGSYQFGLMCNEVLGDMLFQDIRIAALVMGTA